MKHWRTAAGIAVVIVMGAAGLASADSRGSSEVGAGANYVRPFSSTMCGIGNTRLTWVVVGNWDGIGGDGVGVVYDNGTVLEWHLRNSPQAGAAEYRFAYGDSGDLPVVGNWDGIGGDGPGITRSIGHEWQWHLRNGNNSGPPDYKFSYGRDNYTPITGNWDGVGGDDPGVAGGRDAGGNKAWHLRNAPGGGVPNYDFIFGLESDWPMAGNWDGIGGDGPGIARTTSGVVLEWHLRNANNNGPTDYKFGYGHSAEDCHVNGNWDGIGGDGPGIVRRVGNVLQWHLRNGNHAGPAEYKFDYGSPI